MQSHSNSSRRSRSEGIHYHPLKDTISCSPVKPILLSNRHIQKQRPTRDGQESLLAESTLDSDGCNQNILIDSAKRILSDTKVSSTAILDDNTRTFEETKLRTMETSPSPVRSMTNSTSPRKPIRAVPLDLYNVKSKGSEDESFSTSTSSSRIIRIKAGANLGNVFPSTATGPSQKQSSFNLNAKSHRKRSSEANPDPLRNPGFLQAIGVHINTSKSRRDSSLLRLPTSNSPSPAKTRNNSCAFRILTHTESRNTSNGLLKKIDSLNQSNRSQMQTPQGDTRRKSFRHQFSRQGRAISNTDASPENKFLSTRSQLTESSTDRVWAPEGCDSINSNLPQSLRSITQEDSDSMSFYHPPVVKQKAERSVNEQATDDALNAFVEGAKPELKIDESITQEESMNVSRIELDCLRSHSNNTEDRGFSSNFLI